MQLPQVGYLQISRRREHGLNTSRRIRKLLIIWLEHTKLLSVTHMVPLSWLDRVG